LRQEARMQADVRVTTLPQGLDPDDVVLKDRLGWQRVLDNAKPIVVHVMESLAAGQNLDDAKVRSSIASQVTPLIEDVPSAVERDTYRQQLARLLKVDERSLLGNQKVRGRTRRSVPGMADEAARNPQRVVEVTIDKRILQMEKHCLSIILRRPERYYDLERSLKQVNLEKFSEQDFEDSQNQELAALLLKGIRQDEFEVIDYIRDHADEDFIERMNELCIKDKDDDKVEERILEDLYRTLVSLRLIRTNQVLNQLRYLQEEEDTDRDDKALQKMILENTLARGRLDQALVRALIKR